MYPLQVFGTIIMKIIEDGFVLVVDSIHLTHLPPSEDFEQNFAITVRKLLSSSSNNSNYNQTHNKSLLRVEAKKSHHN